MAAKPKPKPKTTTRAGLDSAIWSVCDNAFDFKAVNPNSKAE